MQSTMKLFLPLLLCFLPPVLIAQAWTPAKGEGMFMVTYQNQYTADHLDGDNQRFDAGKIRLQGVENMIDFGITNRLAFTAAAPIAYGVYHGAFPHALDLDNGHYHGAISDLSLGLRYNIATRPVMLTPFVLGMMPSHEYRTFSHAAIGTDTSSFTFGVNVGRQLRPFMPNAYVEGMVSYSIVQKEVGFRPNRNNASLQFGYFVTPRLQLRALANAQVTHGGIDFPALVDALTNDPTGPIWQNHDAIENINYLNAGAGADFSLTRKVDISSTWQATAWGEMGHALNSGFTIGVSYMFTTPWARPSMKMHAKNDMRGHHH
jgi:hypothetical protein